MITVARSCTSSEYHSSERGLEVMHVELSYWSYCEVAQKSKSGETYMREQWHTIVIYARIYNCSSHRSAHHNK